MNKLAVVFVGVVALVVGIALGSAQRTGQSTKLAGPTNTRVYAMNAAISAMPFWVEPRRTWLKIGSVTPGLQTIFGGPTDSDPGKQIEELEALIAKKVNGIVVFSTDPKALVPTIDKAVDQGIPVVTVFADLPESKRLAYVGANQVESAKAVANQVIKDFPDRVKPNAKVLISFGKAGAEDQDKRRQGIEEVIKGKMQLVNPVVDDYESNKAAEAVRAALTLNPDIKFIFGCDSQSAIGAISALKELGKKPGDVIVTGWDSDEIVVKQIKGTDGNVGWIHATAVLYSSYMVQVCFSLLEANHFGYLHPDLHPQKLNTPTFPQTIQIPMKIVTAANVDDYLGKE